ncbi:MAG: response regulator, partial [bacterium]
RLDGSLFETEVSLNRMALGNQVMLLAIVRDITERKQTELERTKLQEKLERAERMESLGVLAGGVAHDLNNMLGPLVGYPELIERKLDDDSPIRKQIQRMGKAAKDAADVIQDLLTLARRGRYEMQSTSLNEVVEGYLDSPSFRKLIASRPDVDLVVRLDRQLSTIVGSAPHLSKVVMNLIVNALDAMPNGGQLVVETSPMNLTKLLGGHDKVQPGDYTVLRIRDSGGGIAAEDLDKIFEPYYSKKKMGTSGSGLGLSVVYGIVKDHKGYYDIFSAPGQGAEFVLYFPVCGEEVESSPTVQEISGGTETILIVDDSTEQRELAAEILAGMGYQVTAAVNGTAAVASLKEHAVDLIVLDMIMETGFDGLDTFRELIKIRPGQKAIIASGFSQTERVDEVLRLGAGQYIRKPYTVQTLAAAVRCELDRTPLPVEQSQPVSGYGA